MTDPERLAPANEALKWWREEGSKMPIVELYEAHRSRLRILEADDQLVEEAAEAIGERLKLAALPGRGELVAAARAVLARLGGTE